jgi:DMSO/TMAO reductase YedYZ heme-binding membrane subunit
MTGPESEKFNSRKAKSYWEKGHRLAYDVKILILVNIHLFRFNIKHRK